MKKGKVLWERIACGASAVFMLLMGWLFAVMILGFNCTPVVWFMGSQPEQIDRVITEVVDYDTDGTELHLLFYYDHSNQVNLAFFTREWNGYEMQYNGKWDEWRYQSWSQSRVAGKYLTWGVGDTLYRKVWLDDPVNEYANIFYTGDLCIWYAFTALPTAGSETVQFIA